ncbi:EutN/CcmL family microcompartment protein [Afifella aestuarii]|uniref:EutN/CcmL family microcompartment protein n=1 Tax=Afifella aestuarii TaxID=1909496 RepID=UPI000FE4004F|nr:EutN/CcmL family microcompartment protein [Afifella aestuarii]
MQLATVIGTVVATRKDDALVGYKLLVLETSDGSRIVAIDLVGAGGSDTVLYVTGGAARVKLDKPSPVDAAVVGIVDTVDVRS